MTSLIARSNRVRRQRLFFESLESRTMLTTLSVDINDPGCAAPGDNLYCLIQEAVDAASSGDEIEVHAGTYQESVNISTDNLEIREASPNSNPVIDATGLDNGLVVDADGVTINGLEARNASFAGFLINCNDNTLTYNTAKGNSHGFVIFGSNNDLTNNTAQDNEEGFALAAGSSNNALTDNTAFSNRFGFTLFFSNGNTLTGNTAMGNDSNGFTLFESSSDNTITENTARDNTEHGFFLVEANGNTLTDNTAKNNVQSGFVLQEGSSGNTLTDNTAEGNGNTGFFIWLAADNNTFTGNLAQQNGAYGFFVDVLLGNVFVDNECFKNKLGGSNVPGVC